MNPSPKIGYVLKRFPRLSETFILNELLELERQGTPLQIYSLMDVAEEEPDKPRHKLVQELRAEVIYLPARQPLKKWRVKRGHFHQDDFAPQVLKDICGGDVPPDSILLLQAALIACMARAQGVNHLHAHFGTDAASVAMLAARLTGLPFSFTAHAKDIFHNDVDPGLLRQKIREARFVITVSDFNRRHLAKLAGPDLAHKIIRLYNGIDLERFQPDPAVTRERDLILAVGRLQEKKGFHHLIYACRILKDMGQAFRCVIVGEGPERDALARQIVECGVQDQLVLAGAQPQEQIIETFKRATLFVLPCVISAAGDRDALPTVLLEAMAMGLPVISTELVGIPEIIDHGKNGLLVPPDDPVQLAKAMAEILNHPKLQESLGRAAPGKAAARFDLRKNVPVLQDLFSRSVAGQDVCQPSAEAVAQ